MRTLRWSIALSFWVFAATPPVAYAQKFPPVIWDDDDRQTVPEPETRKLADWYDFLSGTFGEPALRLFDMPRNFRKLAGKPKEAENINGVDEVPNSSWFTNRNFSKPLSPEEFARGPNITDGPDLSGPWTVIQCKTQGVTPGITIHDVRGDVYLLKFDPPEYPELTSAADVIGSKIFHAAGYNVPENSIVFFTPDRLKLGPGCLIIDEFGRAEPLTQAMLDEMLRNIPKTHDGKLRAIASKFLPGKPKGPFSYSGWREDDPNDVIVHEHRRELRGLRVIAAFINHNDIRQINTLDMYVEENGRKFLKHHFIDFGATLGSASVFPNRPYEGIEYFFDTAEILKRTVTLGLYPRKWQKSPEVKYPAVGYFESELFDPGNWKPNYPIASFENMSGRDGYWGAKIVASFTDAQIEAAVRAGRISDPEAERFLLNVLKRRRDRIAEHWFRRIGPLDRFRIEQGRLWFDDLAVQGGYDCVDCASYQVNVGARSEIVKAGEPVVLPELDHIRVRLTRISKGWPQHSVDVHTRRENGVVKIVGVKR